MKPILDASGAVVGYENDVSEYRKEIRSRDNALLGYFNPKEGPDGKTHVSSGRVVGSGDQRQRLIQNKP